MTRLTILERRLLKDAIKEANDYRDSAIKSKRYYERREFIEHNVHDRSLTEDEASHLMKALYNIHHYTNVIDELKERLRGR